MKTINNGTKEVQLTDRQWELIQEGLRELWTSWGGWDSRTAKEKEVGELREIVEKI
jgi:hypothetical protein